MDLLPRTDGPSRSSQRRIHVILALALAAIVTASTVAVRSDWAPATERSRAVAQEVLADHVTPGMALGVAVQGEAVWTEGFGYADRERRVEATAETRFGLGSVTKTLTMTLCARLVQDGRLEWDTPVEDYLPEFPHAGKGITVRLIGAHLSGMGDDWAGPLRYTMDHYDTPMAYAGASEQALVTEPGAKHLYGTGTFNVIAAVVESVTGMGFDAAMRQWVLDPLEMHDTVVNDPRVEMPTRTVFYDNRYGGADPVVFDPSHKLAGAGYVSTVGDMLRFGSAFFDREFLKGRVRKVLFANAKTTAGESTGFGLGWRITQDEGQTVYYQPGGGPGISCYLVLYPEEQLVFVALSNYTRGPTGGRVMGETLEAFLAAARGG